MFSKDSLILVKRHMLKHQKLKTHTHRETHYWLFSKAGMLVGAAAMEIHSQMQAGWEETRWRQLLRGEKWTLVIIIGCRMENTLV